MAEEFVQKLGRYEKFIHEKLQPDLKYVLDRRDEIYEEISEYLKLKATIGTLEKAEVKELKTMVDVGSNFYVQAKIPDATYIYVNVGFGFHLQMTFSEACAFIDRKEVMLQKKADKYTQEAAKIRAHLKLTMEAMNEVMMLQGVFPEI